mmetsp:Transcript_105349/g.304025  ORF Transcript_105349/g.304025 Transcript_105349/m.304025 type:complete len:330 (-) Transcript_105349:643-1632(-)
MGNKFSGGGRRRSRGSEELSDADLTMIQPGLYLSSQQPVKYPSSLKEKGITRVITVLPAPIKTMMNAKGFETLHIPVDDLGTEPLDDFFMKAYKFITASDFDKTGSYGSTPPHRGRPGHRMPRATLSLDPPCTHDVPTPTCAPPTLPLAPPPGTATLVHCSAGRSRSASVVIAYLMISKRVGVKDAYYEVAGKRDIQPNTGFIKQLVRLEGMLNLGGQQDVSILHTTTSGESNENMFLAEYVIESMMGGADACPCTTEEMHAAIEDCDGVVSEAQLLVMERVKKRGTPVKGGGADHNGQAGGGSPSLTSGRSSPSPAPTLVSGRRSPST